MAILRNLFNKKKNDEALGEQNVKSNQKNSSKLAHTEGLVFSIGLSTEGNISIIPLQQEDR